jgi:hypothetical protein
MGRSETKEPNNTGDSKVLLGKTFFETDQRESTYINLLATSQGHILWRLVCHMAHRDPSSVRLKLRHTSRDRIRRRGIIVDLPSMANSVFFSASDARFLHRTGSTYSDSLDLVAEISLSVIAPLP